ncbi:MAG: hypothetical protein U0229_21960 [Anaeromyxobacter sp.]
MAETAGQGQGQGGGADGDVELKLRLQAKTGAFWLWAIAALSVVNTLSALTSQKVSVFMGLAATAVLDRLAASGGAGVRAAGLAAALAVAAGFAFLGVLANRGKAWAAAVALGLYALDAVAYGWLGLWPNVAFHALAGFFVVRGFFAQQALDERRA